MPGMLAARMQNESNQAEPREGRSHLTVSSQKIQEQIPKQNREKIPEKIDPKFVFSGVSLLWSQASSRPFRISQEEITTLTNHLLTIFGKGNSASTGWATA